MEEMVNPGRKAGVRNVLGQALPALIAAAVWFAPFGAAQSRHAYAIAAFMILAWALGAMEYWIAGLIGCFLFWALQVAPLKAAFGGFITETPWFSLGALLLGALGVRSGLAVRIAHALIRRVAPSYGRLLLCLSVTSFLLTFLVPSGVARVVIMAGVSLGVIRVLDLKADSNIARGLFLCLTYSASIFDKMILAGSAAMASRQLIFEYGHVKIGYSAWLVAFLPISILSVVLLPLLTIWLFPAEPDEADFTAVKTSANVAKPWTAIEAKAIFLFVGALLLWLTEPWHGLSPAVVGLGAGLIAAMPAFGLLTTEEVRRVNLPSVFFVGATLSMAAVLTSTGATRDIAHGLGAILTTLPTHPVALVGGLYGLGFAAHLLLASELSMFGASMPAIMQFAAAHHLNVEMVGLAWTFSAAGKVFIYQSTVLVVGASYGFFRPQDLFKFGLAISGALFLLIAALAWLYWPLIGLR